MSRPRATFAEPRTENPKFPLHVSSSDPHQIRDLIGRLVDSYVSASDAAWVVRERNARWEAAQKERAERLANEERERRAALEIPGVRPNAPFDQGKDQP